MRLMNINNRSELQPILREIVSKPLPVRLFLRALYVNPNKTKAELQNLCDNLDSSTTASSNNARQVLKFCNLTSNCKNCLLYMSIFPEDTIFERTRLVRRWAVEGMTAKRGRLSALHEADHCFDLLVSHGFLTPRNTSDTAKVKSYTMDDIILDIVTQIAREDHFVKNTHHPDLAHRLSVHYEGQPHQAEKELNVTRSQACWNICGHQATVEQSNATKEFLESLPSSSHSGTLKVLDLEDCNDLKDRHLKNICIHVFHLKYLSLRKTGITELPRQLDKLQSLEFLDIRETKVKAFAKNSVFLPKLKHLLAGHWTDEELVVNGNVQSKEKFSTVAMPTHIGDMTELQVISHIAVSGDGSELKYAGYLLQLVKLGVVVSGNKTSSVLRHLYHATGNLGFLRSLTIQVAESEEENENVNKRDAYPIYPKYLHKLKISGLKNGLPSWIEKLKVLTKVTLHMTFITEHDFEILGRLTSLSLFKLKQDSCTGCTVTFKKDAFQSLEFLHIKCSAITSINFDNEACLKLKRLAWYSTGEQSLLGIERLPRLKKVELTGNHDWKIVKQALSANQNKPTWAPYGFRRW
ncbi:disease resistance protein Pik-2-like [Triticum aestivum]|uniref:disease resistance protein Pik-2-like n=1 Tax=Triticum aestivum TaxID=4565 RepID=UPI001D03302F|nr:disease resistance protein Pik-2-like [Triticum aestivum]